MLRDSVALVIAFFVLVVQYSVFSPVFYIIIDDFAATSEHAALWTDLLKWTYLLVHGMIAAGIIIWYISRAHREEYESDYFIESGYRFMGPSRWSGRRRYKW